MGNITKSDTEVSNPCIKVVVKMSKWENYIYQTDSNGIVFIVGFNNQPSNNFNYVQTENGILLFELLKLYKSIYNSCDRIFSSNQHHVNSLLSEEIINSVLGFCRKYGLPFWNPNTTANIFSNENYINESFRNKQLDKIPSFNNCNSFPICSFISGLQSLHTDFLNMVAFKHWNEDFFIETLLTDKDNERIVLKLNKNRFSLYTPSLCNFVTEWNDADHCLRMNCESIMQLAVYHLCILFQSETFNGCGGSWRMCEKCGQIFYASRSNQKYCYNPCTKQAALSARKRIKKKF